ncbi:MAG TPA: DUF2939 domain-containing protein [Chthoniobacterales bacterium]|nr:DUF2939 domain-containing protein [Chthoniobacterales bacterium]
MRELDPALTITTPAPPPRRSRLGLVVAIAVVVLLLYAAAPYYSVWRFGEALRAHDMDAIAARVDFGDVRGSLKQQIRDHFEGVLKKNASNQNDLVAQFLTAAANDPLGQLIDMYITPEGLAALIADPNPIRNASSISALPSLAESPRPVDWSIARRAFFTGPREFTLDHEGIKLRFRLDGKGWRLHEVDLELESRK